MIWLLSVIAFIFIFSLLILIHEFGHFMVARKCGVKVLEFGLGMPPRIWGKKPKKSETLYSINAIPFGGFVRLYGEDTTDAKLLKNKRSFAAQSPWKKMAVVVAGVVMNFLLAFVLLTIGLTWGMQPLFVSSDDVFNGIKSGVVKLQEGIIVKEAGPNDIGFLPGDRILSVNGKRVLFGDEVASLMDKQGVLFKVMRKDQIIPLTGINNLKKPFFTLYDPMVVPKLVVKSISDDSKLNIKAGDTIEKVNGQMIFNMEDLSKELIKPGLPHFDVTAAGSGYIEDEDEMTEEPVVISTVIPGSNAEQAGLKEGDEILAINGMNLKTIQDLQVALQKVSLKDKAVYKIHRGESEIEFFVRKDEQGLIGVLLSEVFKLDGYGATFYMKSEPYSVIKVGDVSYPFWEAPGQALKEMGRLSILTVEMFGNVLSSIFTKLSVPEGVAGPVGIAQMTFVFVQEGLMSLIRFTALLSLSLAIINILPFPGLDGGRLFLILIPLIIRRKLNPRWEAMIHVLGFLILMLLIFLVTFNDIMRLFV
jgi:regulator of sigma E protease